MKYLFSLLLLTGFSDAIAQDLPRKFTLPEKLEEASGLIIENQQTLWWHNDSGGDPILYGTNVRGEIVDSVVLESAVNRDWEDLTADSQGNWYIGDFGNNRNNRKDLTIYRLNRHSGQLDSTRFSYPQQTEFPPAWEQANFNMEGFFFHEGMLHLFSKNAIGRGTDITRHYTLPAIPGSYQAELVDSLYLKDRVVTAAAISPDGKKVAILTYTFGLILGIFPKSKTSLFIFEEFPEGRFLQGTMATYRIRRWPMPDQYEAVDFWDNETVIIASEKTLNKPARGKVIQLK